MGDAKTKHVEPLGFKEHPIRVGDGAGGWDACLAECQFLHDRSAERLMPFGIVQMDNGDVLFLGSAESQPSGGGPWQFEPVTALSADGGATWTEFARVPDLSGRPMMLTYLGRGNLGFQSAEGATSSAVRVFSHDYGRTWPERVALTGQEGEAWGVEGNAHVDYDPSGKAARVAEIGFKSYSAAVWPEAFEGHFRWSTDEGRTWEDEVKPETWQVEMEWRGERFLRGVSEGSIVRAKNGWLVAALRLDMPPRFYTGGAEPHVAFDDSLEGLAISISRDDGRTWSPMTMLFEAGRHHPHLLALPNGDIVMTYVVRVDVREGRLASYRRGCEALVSTDNGETWDTSRRVILDEFEFFDGRKWFNGETGHLASALLDDGRILTAYGNYVTKGACLIRWQP